MSTIWIGDAYDYYQSPLKQFIPNSTSLDSTSKTPIPITYINSRAEAEIVREGQLIKRWDYCMKIKNTYLYPAELDLLRRRGDVLADKVVEILNLGVGVDGLEAIRLRVESILERRKNNLIQVDDALIEEENHILNFWNEIHLEYGNKDQDEYLEFHRQEGRDVFWKYSTEIFGSLLHFSLAGGFSAPKLAAVMKETNYLTSASKEATYKRLLETTLFVIDAMTDMTVGSGRGWKSAVRVRILHAQVRRRIKVGKGRLNTYDVETMGIPINQQDLCTVLGSFMIAPLWSLKRLGFKLSAREASSFQAVWKHVGFYLGIEPDLLEKFYGQSHDLAEESFACLGFDAFPDEIPVDGYNTPTFQILNAVSGRPPRQTGVGYHLEYSRALLGPGLAHQLALPRGSLYDRYKVAFDASASYCLITFGHYYPFKRWEQNRVSLMKRVLELLVVWQLGSRRPLYAEREDSKQAEKFTESEGEAPGIVMGVEAGLEVKRQWKLMLAEVVAVVGTFGVVTAGISYFAVKAIINL